MGYSKRKLVFYGMCIAVVLISMHLGMFDGMRTIHESAQGAVEPVIRALQMHKDRHQRYPQCLEDLVAEGLLPSIPRIPMKLGVTRCCGLTYSVSADGGFYYMSFSYDELIGVVFRDVIVSFRTSEDDWRISKYPPSFDELLARYAGKRYRKYGQADDLKMAIESLGACRSTQVEAHRDRPT